MASVVNFENVSKKFILHHQKARSFQDALVNLFHRRNGTAEEFWALRDVSLEIRLGETLGIIGENGSGKSTILKLITRILEPTSGKVQVSGKVSALIEVGAGFHPDLTGRENIYLNGSILGLSRKEMDRRFDQIVAFSELERFIDTTVKHYSSGMYMRLGFSVAISVDPDILIVDEVLAVGDEVFQRKCLDRIEAFRQQGKTIIFVSHSLQTVEHLCDRVVWLHEGAIQAEGAAAWTIHRYLEELQRHDERNRALEHKAAADKREALAEWPGTRTAGGAEIADVRLMTDQRREKYSFRTGETVVVRLRYRVSDPAAAYVVGLELRRGDGLLIYRTFSEPQSDAPAAGDGLLEVEFPNLPLGAGAYDVALSIRPADAGPGGWVPGGPPCRFTIWGELDQAGVVALEHRWRAPIGEPGFVVAKASTERSR